MGNMAKAALLLAAIVGIVALVISGKTPSTSIGHRTQEPPTQASRVLSERDMRIIRDRCLEVRSAPQLANEALGRQDVEATSLGESCVPTQASAAISGRPSYLTMTPFQFNLYTDIREITPEETKEAESLYKEIVRVCSGMAALTMFAQPLAPEVTSIKGTDTERVVALIIGDMREVKKPEFGALELAIAEGTLKSHMKTFGANGSDLPYFLDLFDRCVDLQAAAMLVGLVEGIWREDSVLTIINGGRARLMEGFQKSQALRDGAKKRDAK